MTVLLVTDRAVSKGVRKMTDIIAKEIEAIRKRHNDIVEMDLNDGAYAHIDRGFLMRQLDRSPWISVEDRLPVVETEVLVNLRFPEPMDKFTEFRRVAYVDDSGWHDEWGHELGEFVTHWQEIKGP